MVLELSDRIALSAPVQELAAQLAAVQAGDAPGDMPAMAEENAALRHAVAELEAKV